MLILISISLLLLAPLSMLGIRLFKPDFVYHWLIAVGGTFVAWLLILFTSIYLPQAIPLASYKPDALFPSWPMLLIDRLSWPFAVALGTLVFAVILADVSRAPEADWSTWSGCLILAALGLFTTLAGNPLTLLMGWMAIDIVELLILFAQVKESNVRERVMIAFTARVLGSVLLMVAGVITRAVTGEALTFAVIPPSAGLFLLLAAGLRLGVLPFHLPFLHDLPLRRSLGTMTRLVPAAAALVLLARTATADQISPLSSILLGLTGLAAVYSGITWMLAKDELEGRQAWILGMASLAMASAIRMQPTASLAWGIAAIFSGGLIFLSAIRDRRLLWITLLGVWGISGLPYSPTWNGIRLFIAPFQPLMLVFFIAQVFFIVGYVHHTLTPRIRTADVERWVWLIYPLGLILLPTAHIMFGIWTNPGIVGVPMPLWWVGAISLTAAAFFLWADWRAARNQQDLLLLPAVITFFGNVFSLNWAYRLLWSIYRFLSRPVAFINEVLEGEGGVLWAFLVLVLLLLWLMNRGGG
jgi:hypothetical protein